VASGTTERAAAERARGPARELTSAEVRVLSTLLAADALPERERIRSSGVSPRTYETARRRAFEAGWVYERFVPDPLAWGMTHLRLEVIRPPPSEEPSAGRRLAAESGAFHIWQGNGLVFAASFAAPAGAARDEDPGGRSWALDADLRQPSVPIFFDFEGAWSRIAGTTAPRVYPRPLPYWRGAGTSAEARPPARVRREAEGLIRRPFSASRGRPAGGHLGSLFGSGGRRGALAARLVQRRCFLDLARLPGFGGWRLQSLAFLTGELRSGEPPELLFHELLFDGGLTPFLFAADRKSVLIGALSPAPPAPATRPRTRVSAILEKRLESTTLVTTPVSSLSTPLNHRYDRFLPAEPA
jgi:hypothetical protein